MTTRPPSARCVFLGNWRRHASANSTSHLTNLGSSLKMKSRFVLSFLNAHKTPLYPGGIKGLPATVAPRSVRTSQLVHLNVTAAKRTAFLQATIYGNGEGVGPLRLIIILHCYVESARYAVVSASAAKTGGIAGDNESAERHTMHLCAAGVVHILQVTMDRSIARLSLHDEAKVRNASANIDGATARHPADGRPRRQHYSGDLRDEGIGWSPAVISLERARSNGEVRW